VAAAVARVAVASKFKTGMRVFHAKFGMGTILSVAQDKLEIDFDNADVKRLLDRYVEIPE
jgi:DNA helicase-2/ATP-dependent DNA helicase PcrA